MGVKNYQKSIRYRKNAYDQIGICIKKGEREAWKKQAEYRHLSLAGYIQKLVEDDMWNIVQEKMSIMNEE